MLVLELPTGGLADALGRKPVLVLAGAVSLASLAMLAVAPTRSCMFVGRTSLLQGVYRALDSGPLEAWYVDPALAADPKADIERGLCRGGVVIGVSIAGGALLGRRPGRARPDRVASRALTVPVIVAVALQRRRPGRAGLADGRGPAGPGRPRAARVGAGGAGARSAPRVGLRAPLPDRRSR